MRGNGVYPFIQILWNGLYLICDYSDNNRKQDFSQTPPAHNILIIGTLLYRSDWEGLRVVQFDRRTTQSKM